MLDSGGLDILWSNGVTLKLETIGRWADGFHSYRGTAKVSIPF